MKYKYLLYHFFWEMASEFEFESEFVHPQTINPFALLCPNLESLTLINPSVVTDNLFFGEVPELATKSFGSLKKLTFEGDTISFALGKFLLEHSTSLSYLLLSVTTYDDVIKSIIDLLISKPRVRLENAIFVLENVKADADSFVIQLFKLIEVSPKMSKFQLIVRQGNQTLKNSIEEFKVQIGVMNWELEFLCRCDK